MKKEATLLKIKQKLNDMSQEEIKENIQKSLFFIKSKNRKRDLTMMKDFCENKLTINEIAEMNNVHISRLSQIKYRYFNWLMSEILLIKGKKINYPRRNNLKLLTSVFKLAIKTK